MKALAVGLMILAAMMGVEMAHAQTCALIYTLVPLTDNCDGGDPLPDGTQVCIHWDIDNDGPDGTDPFPEGANFSCFGMNGEEFFGMEGVFYTDPAFCIPGGVPQPSAFYVRVHIGGNENLCWTSEVFAIPPGFGEIELDDWSCGPCPTGEVPGPVTGLTATLDSCNLIYIGWDNVPGAQIYQFFVDGLLYGFLSIPEYEYDVEPTDESCHDFSVRAANDNGVGPLSTPAIGCAVRPPHVPALVTASDDQCTVEIGFSFDSYSFVTEVQILRFDQIIGTLPPGLPGQLRVFLDESPLSQPALYAVRSWNQACGAGTAHSDMGQAIGVYHAPATATASSNFDDRIEISWTSVTGETGYEILRSAYSHAPQFDVVGTTPANVLTYTDYSAESGQEYLYRVRAYDAVCGVGPLSIEARGHRATVEPVIFGEFRVTNNLAGVMSAEAADLDEDGDLDVVAAGMFADKVAWYENDGQWNFTEHVLLDRWQGARAVSVGDIDSDGDLDIAAVATFENALIWLEQHPDGFWFHHISSEVMGPTDILISDLVGGTDIITTAADGAEISGWTYNGDAQFGRELFETNLPGVRSLARGRFYPPSGPWLCAAAAESGEVVWFRSITGYDRETRGIYPGLVACGGADLSIPPDSFPDVFYCTNGGELGWRDWHNDSLHIITSILDELRDVTSGLMDRDDRQDLVVASGHEITWWRNTSNRFYRNVVTDNLPQASFVSTLDADGDGDMDILAAGDNEIRLYLSTLRDLDNTTQLVPAPEDEHDGQAFGLPTEYALEQNYPNPFNAQTTIRFALPAAGAVHLSIYDLTGREAAQLINGTLNAGTHTVNFDASGLASGVYFYRIAAAGYTETRKMVLMK